MMNKVYIVVSVLVLLFLVVFPLSLRFLHSEKRKEAKYKKELKRRAAQIYHHQQELDALSAQRQERVSKKGS
ncbi:hypothetical protein [Aneurinibacillus sp. REN35]|uniref:hypothetical protein n=1 Tax=Aneurinibacillus sp. REN35 TaxID=3237286 RepID=UPI003527697F